MSRFLGRAGAVPLVALLATVGFVPVASAAVAPAASGGVPAAYRHSTVLFSDTFPGSTLAAASWNPYLTSRAAQGAPWNSDGAGGSSPANPAINYDLEYDVASQVHVHNGLVIRARRAPVLGRIGSRPVVYPWRAGAVTSYGHFEFTGGYLEVTAKLPSQPGIWPAIWMLPGGPTPGSDNYEIDLFEGGMTAAGIAPSEDFSWHLHTPVGTFGGGRSTGVPVSSGFHTYGLAWVPGRSLTWYFDGREMASLTSAQAPIPTEPMELVMNLEVANQLAASWHTMAPPQLRAAVMRVRSVRVYR